MYCTIQCWDGEGVFVRDGSPGFNRYRLHYVKFTRIKYKPFIFPQNISV